MSLKKPDETKRLDTADNPTKKKGLNKGSKADLFNEVERTANDNVQPKTEIRLQPSIRTHWNRLHLSSPHYAEAGGGKSKTVPDQSLSIRELIERSQRGYPIDAQYTTFYNGEDEDLPDLRRLDLTDLQELKNWTNERIKDGQKFMQEQYEKAQEKNTEEYYRKKFAAEQKEKETPPIVEAQPKIGD